MPELHTDLAFCLADDRRDCAVGLQLAILSVAKHCPGTPIYVYRPRFNDAFEDWAAQFDQVTVIPHTPAGASAWNCKPHAMTPLLEKHRQVVWLDSDIIVTNDCVPLFMALDEKVVVVAQEPASLPHQGTEHRTRGWGFEVGRSLPITLNSCVVRATRHHLHLLKQWTACMAAPEYVAAQDAPLSNRPVHLMSDQDVLNALLGAAEFADTPIRVLQVSKEVIHAGGALGYSLRERLSGLLLPKPTFLHAAAGKPWLWLSGEDYWSRRNFFGWHRRLLQEISPYVSEARRYENDITDSSWLKRRTMTGNVLRVLGFGHFALSGLPITFAATVVQSSRDIFRQPHGKAR